MSLPWQSKAADLKSRLLHLFDTKVLSDCSFLVGKGNGHLVDGHKVIVSAASPVLQDMLEAAEGDHPVITLTDIEPEIFELMLKYVYTDVIDVNADTVGDLITAGSTYNLSHMLKACFDFIATNLTPKNVLKVYDFVLHRNENIEDGLKEQCEEVLRTKTKEVLTDSSLEESSLDVVVAVFSLDTMDIDSELDLLNAADRYAKHSKCEKADNGSLTIRNVLEKIRFLTLTTEEFGKGQTSTSLVSSSEACAILNNIVYDNSKVPMPSGFSQSRNARKKEIKITFHVPNIEGLINENKQEWSSVFELQNLKWKIRVNKERDSVNYLAIYAFCNWESESDKWSCNAQVKFKLLRTDKEEPISKSYTHNFKRGASNLGYDKFIEVSKLLDPNNHYVKEGVITFEINIQADKAQGL